MENLLIKKYIVVLAISVFSDCQSSLLMPHSSTSGSSKVGLATADARCPAKLHLPRPRGEAVPPPATALPGVWAAHLLYSARVAGSVAHIHRGRYRLDILTVSFTPKRKTREIPSLIFVFVFKLFSEQLKKKKEQKKQTTLLP